MHVENRKRKMKGKKKWKWRKNVESYTLESKWYLGGRLKICNRDIKQKTKKWTKSEK